MGAYPIAAARSIISLAAALALLSGALIAALQPARANEPPLLDAPESAYWHAGTASWYVTSLGGGLSMARDGYGWISRFDASGRLLDARWLEGLDAPTGMASVGDTLYVVDRAGLLEVSLNEARVLRTLELPGALFANDAAAADDGTVYVSDTGTDRIYRLPAGGAIEVWLESPALQGPNGLWVDGGTLLVATWGPIVDPATFATRHPGTILKVDRATGDIAPLGDGQPIASFDGIVKVDEGFFATDYSGGRLLHFDAAGRYEVVISGLGPLADLGYNPQARTLALPAMADNRLVLLNLEQRR